MRLALYQPDIAQNVGAALRLAACFDVPLDIIEPCGFPLTEREVRRVAMDYGADTEVQRWPGWTVYERWAKEGQCRLVLMTTAASTPLWAHAFAAGDIVLLGQESAGVPEAVRMRAETRLRIPLSAAARSFNIVTAAAITLGEASRQLQWLPGSGSGPRA